MATAKVNKKNGPVVELPECPVCLEVMSAPIFQCMSGHSLCNTCTKNLMPPNCPICREAMTQMRNWQLEDLISKAPLACPNQAAGCTYKMAAAMVENHLKECIFRVMTCPLGIFGKCSWSGVHKELFNHFKECHPQNMLTNLNEAVSIHNISNTEDDRFVYIIFQGKMIFILTLKTDIHQKLAYWVVQLIGSKKVAENYVYEINITSLQDNRRQVTFYDHCFSDAMVTNDIFRLARCCVMPLNYLSHFINQKTVTFNLNVKRHQPLVLNHSAKEPNTGPKHYNSNPNYQKPENSGPKNPSANTRAPRPPGKKPYKNNQNQQKQPTK